MRKKMKSYYFKHDYHARHDMRLQALCADMGMEGLGIYWSIVEMLYENDGRLMRSYYERITFELHSNIDSITRVVEGYELFQFDDEYFWSVRALEELKEVMDKSEKARKSIQKRWSSSRVDTNVLPTKNEGNTIRKDNIRYKIYNTNGIPPSPLFDEWWNTYDKKVGDRKKIQLKFTALSPEDQAKAIEHTKAYVKSTPEKQYRKNPETYINQQGWTHEIITPLPTQINGTSRTSYRPDPIRINQQQAGKAPKREYAPMEWPAAEKSRGGNSVRNDDGTGGGFVKIPSDPFN